jgi:lysophospholipase L1-like esterase
MMKTILRLILCFTLVFRALAQAADPNAPVQVQNYQAPIRVACVGDSITLGSGTKLPLLESYPAQLQRMLDPKTWLVENFGVSGATLLNKGDKPYQKQKLFQDALNFNPDVAIIMFGANDSKPQNWKFKDGFTADYQDLIGKFKALPSHPRIFICRPMVAPGAGNYGITDPVILQELPLIEAVAKDEAVGLIDMHAALLGKDALVPDRVHPNADGANFLSRTAYRALTGAEFTGTLDPVVHSEWLGWPQIQFESAGRVGLLVLPKTPAPGNPWIWRTEFFNTEPQGDLALLAKGWVVAYLNVQNMYGAPAALDAMDKFYTQVVKENHLASKVVLEGFSRGGLFAFNWAARNPGEVAAIYADAPVLDFKSWPAGKGKGQGSPQDWQRLLKVYGLTEEQALAYKLNPLDNLKPLADAKIPILSICGDSDKTVPFDENTQIMASRYKELGGEIQVILKPGGDHHPHSLTNPAPIVEFVLKHAPTPQ